MWYRDYNKEKDKKAVNRIWLEVGWMDKDKPEGMDSLIDSGRTIVADVNGEAECLVVSHLGDVNYLGESLRFSCIAGVTTSLVARKQKLAGRLTAVKIAQDVLDGAIISGLGMFEQGYYDMLGFGTGGYEHIIRFAPASLKIDVIPRVPRRISSEDWREAHEYRMKRMRSHGTCGFDQPETTRAGMQWCKTGFGFGYNDEQGKLGHHIWLNGLGKEHGPYRIEWMAYQTYDQFKELLALLKSFGEQIHLVSMTEPPNIQIQDFLDKPFWHQTITQKSEYENAIKAIAYWQMRICDLPVCMTLTHLEGKEVRFNLELSDPITRFFDSDSKWKGISGNYIVTLGAASSAVKGSDNNLPTLKASVGAFTRMWLGVLSASSLAVSDQLVADENLIAELDRILRLPEPKVDWEF